MEQRWQRRVTDGIWFGFLVARSSNIENQRKQEYV
jgi:hypothetical protein